MIIEILSNNQVLKMHKKCSAQKNTHFFLNCAFFSSVCIYCHFLNKSILCVKFEAKIARRFFPLRKQHKIYFLYLLQLLLLLKFTLWQPCLNVTDQSCHCVLYRGMPWDGPGLLHSSQLSIFLGSQ